MDKDKPVLQLTDIIELLDEIFENFKNSPKRKNITFHKYLLPLPYILIDKYQMEKLFHTLIQNLIKIIEPEGEIEIRTEKEVPFIKIEIKADSINSFKYPGLSIWEKIVEQHGGRLNITNKEQSITVCIYLPLA